MRDEFDRYSPTYAKEKVKVKGESKLDQDQGGVLLFLHFGSFFLSGLSLIHKIGLIYTVIASRRNFKVMEIQERNLWEDVHTKMNKLYSRKMFLTDEPNIDEMIGYLRKGGFIGAALDVAEVDQKHKFHPFEFLYNQIYLQTGPARLARIANVPIYGMNISYDQNHKVHSLKISGPFDQNKIEESIQKLLSEMEEVVSQRMNQLFHDVFRLLTDIRLESMQLKLTSQKKFQQSF